MKYEVLPSADGMRYLWSMHQFRRLDVWRDAVDLATTVYKLTATYPATERYGLTAQMRRAVVSVSSNIAEGAGRGSSKDMARFLRVSIGSICELESQLEVSRALGLVTDVEELISKAGLLKARIKTLEERLILDT